MSKSSHLYKNASWDLVDAVEDEEIDIEEIEVSSLPKELKGKSKEEISEYIDAKSKEREAIKKEIQTLNEKRRVFISTRQSQGSSELQNAMLNALKKQAKKKNYEWN